MDTLPVSVVIPAWCEADNLRILLQKMPRVNELIIVDGWSGDNTAEVVAQYAPYATLLSQEPTGKGNATLAGIAMATSNYIVCMDADGSMHPKEIDVFLHHLRNGYDVVKGSRIMLGGGSSDFTFTRRAGNYALTKIYNIFTGQRMTDITYGYVGLRREAVNNLGLTATGFEVEVQMVAHAHSRGMRVFEIPCYEDNRISGSSRLRIWRDGMRIVSTIMASRKLAGRLDSQPVVC